MQLTSGSAGTTDWHLHDVDADVDDDSAGLYPGAPDQLRPADGDDQDVAVAQDLRQVQGIVVRLRRAWLGLWLRCRA